MTTGQLTWLLVLTVVVVVSGVAVVHAKYESRALFVELESLRAARDQADMEWGRLQLEQSTLATHWRIENKARNELQMHDPLPEQVIVIAPES